MLIVSVVDLDLSEAEISMIHQLMDMETEDCPACKKIYQAYPGWLPVHCNHCRTIRGEQWYFRMRERAKVLFRNGVFA